ncbi:hypothetical protein CR983_02445 [Candidatus Saccharibacteria bacterium]|nr:MAG: hypothetical protein CR983_02445 [Candidatus Saccharibacteria bacterium]
MKITASDCLAILRKFGRADTSVTTSAIDQLAVRHPRSISTLASFRYQKQHYALLFDDTAADSADYIRQQVHSAHPNAHTFLVVNPSSSLTTYGLPFEGKDVYLIALDSNTQRLDAYLAATYPEYSRASWQKHIKAGRISINGRTCTSPKRGITDDDTLDITLPSAPDYSRRELPIIYIDDDVIVVDKPIGVLTHRKNPLDDEFTVADFFRRYTTHGLDTDRPGVVHRLDRDTSGLLIGARSSTAYDWLKTQFADRAITKHYTAVLDGVPRARELRIDVPIGRNPRAPGTFRADASGKPAQTILRVVETAGERALVSLLPRTGRTHQLRVHAAHIGTPILGDRIYGQAADRLYLHAHQLTLTLPSGGTHTFTSAIPESFYLARQPDV